MKPADCAPNPQKFVRVTGCRGMNFIEFEFAIGSPDLFVELILPEAAFAEFCRHNDVEIQPSGGDDDTRADGEWRLRDVQQRITGSKAN